MLSVQCFDCTDSCIGACERIVGYHGRRTAIACLRDLDDRALRDVGLNRFQIEAAVDGLITFPTKRAERRASHRRPRAPTMETAPWS